VFGEQIDSGKCSLMAASMPFLFTPFIHPLWRIQLNATTAATTTIITTTTAQAQIE